MSTNVWIDATRPKTLPAAVAPVAIGTALAFANGGFNPFMAVACLLFALLVQIGTNFANDYYDFEKGADDEKRIGPIRACAAGLIDPESMLNATIITFSAAALIGVGLVIQGGAAFVVVVALCIWAGWAYTGGPYPLGYNGLGELFVLLFFGPVAVGSTYFLQTLELSGEVVVLGFAPGLIATAIIVVNNLRDVDGDRRAGKQTLAVRYGRSFGHIEYIACIVTAAFIPPLTAYWYGRSGFAMLTLLVIPFAVPVMRVVLNRNDGPSLNQALAETGQLLLAFTLAFVVGCLL